MSALRYGDDPAGDYRVELFDKVEVRIDRLTYDGVVKKIHAPSHEVTVQYDDWHDSYRTTAKPRRKSRRVHILAVDLIARDG